LFDEEVSEIRKQMKGIETSILEGYLRLPSSSKAPLSRLVSRELD
jgi:hypothetical protein